jgi:hypothetical protein
VWRALARRDAAGGFDAVHDRHSDVHEHDVGPDARDCVYGIRSVAGLADDMNVRLGLEELDEPGAHELLVVHDEYPGAHRSRS